MDGRLKGYVYIIAASLLGSFGFIFSTIAIRNVNIASAAFFTFFSGLIASTVMLITAKKIAETRKLIRKYWKPIILIGILNVASAVLWLLSLKTVGPSVTAFLGRFGTIFTIILGVMILKEKFNRLEAIGALIMIAGAFILSYNGGHFIIRGVILVIMLSLTFSAWQFITKIYIKRIDPIVMNQVRLMFTFGVFALLTLMTWHLEVPNWNVMILIALGSLAGGVIGFILGYKALEITDLSKVSTIQSLEPFIVMIYSFFILGSIPTGYQMLGGIVIVAGVLLLVMSRYRPKFVERFVE